jgi:hypothetical protein
MQFSIVVEELWFFLLLRGEKKTNKQTGHRFQVNWGGHRAWAGYENVSRCPDRLGWTEEDDAGVTFRIRV